MSISHEVEQFIKDWLEGDSTNEVISWFVSQGMVDRNELRKFLLRVARERNMEALDPQLSLESRKESLEGARYLERLANTL